MASKVLGMGIFAAVMVCQICVANTTLHNCTVTQFETGDRVSEFFDFAHSPIVTISKDNTGALAAAIGDQQYSSTAGDMVTQYNDVDHPEYWVRSQTDDLWDGYQVSIFSDRSGKLERLEFAPSSTPEWIADISCGQ